MQDAIRNPEMTIMQLKGEEMRKTMENLHLIIYIDIRFHHAEPSPEMNGFRSALQASPVHISQRYSRLQEHDKVGSSSDDS